MHSGVVGAQIAVSQRPPKNGKKTCPANVLYLHDRVRNRPNPGPEAVHPISKMPS